MMILRHMMMVMEYEDGGDYDDFDLDCYCVHYDDDGGSHDGVVADDEE